MTERVAAVEGWFTMDRDAPALVGQRCEECGTYVFPPTALTCPNPACTSNDLEQVELSRTGKVWSYTLNHYPPPEPYVAPDPFQPYAVAAVELVQEGLVVLGQVEGEVSGLGVGAEAELVLATLFEDDGSEQVVWKWRVA